jgi:futalosine hydrolase
MSHDTKTLVLVPTELERSRLRAVLGPSGPAADRLELCGFGPVAAAARTALLLGRDRPDRVLLVGIAGAIDARLSPGSARRFAAVACHGIGAGSAADFSPAGAIGWPHWPGDAVSPPIGDTIPLDVQGVAGDAGPLLLTVCAAAGSAADVAERRRLFPAAVAEDMEGFGVALACRLHDVPCAIIRGISNVAGDRDTSRWATAEAVAAAAALANEFLAEAS